MNRQQLSPPQHRFGVIGFIGLILFLSALSASSMAQSGRIDLVATLETDPVPNGGDAADDPSIWIHPSDPSLSTIIGTNKKGGLIVYDLDGKELQYISGIKPNNVDIRYNFPLGGDHVALVTFTNRQNDTIGAYKVNPETRQLENVAAKDLQSNLSVYGFCMYYSMATGKYYAFVDSKKGEVEQWELFDDGSGKVDMTLVRTFDVGTITEGCVADDQYGLFYIAEENIAIWQYNAEPDGGTDRTLVANVSQNGPLHADVEGLTIYYDSNGEGYLLASSQGSSEFIIYKRTGNHDYLATFRITDGNGIDSVTDTDGIDVCNFPLGPTFPKGLFIAQDGRNEGGNQNFKLVAWETIANAVNPALTMDTAWDPRKVGAGPVQGIEDGHSSPESGVPAGYALQQNYPNPFNPSTNIRFVIPKNAEVKLEVYSMLGEHVATLAEGAFTAGAHDVTFQASALPSGTYIVQLDAGRVHLRKRMLFVK